MPTPYLILGKGIKPQKATQWNAALAKAATMSVENPGVEIHLYQLHSSFCQDKLETENREPRTSLS